MSRAVDSGIGDFGPGAYRFVDWLKHASQRFWQVLPLNPTDPVYGNSPYRSRSSFALSPLFISPALLLEQGLLRPADLAGRPRFPQGRVDYVKAAAWKLRLLDRAWGRFKRALGHNPSSPSGIGLCPAAKDPGRERDSTLTLSLPLQGEGNERKGVLTGKSFRRFCREHASWLDDYALYSVLKQKFGGLAWTDWPTRLRRRDRAALKEVADVFSGDMERVRFEQFLAFGQWLALKRYANRKGIGIIGDLPIYVDSDSSDVWAHQELFQLDTLGRPRFVAGVPPDYFSSTGQLWGNPVYRWNELRRTGFAWWLGRIRHALLCFDLVRIDHFRGLAAYWRVPAGDATAERGRWVKAPAAALLSAFRRRFPEMPFLAENLGCITPDVERVRRRFGLPGMKVLLFGFGRKTSPHLPENVEPDTFYYTGTHDNNTVRGWFEHEAGRAEKKTLERLLGRRPSASAVSLELVRACLRSRADTVILPLQDVLGLGQEARVNRPATRDGNWQWRLRPGRPSATHARRLRLMTEEAGRGLTPQARRLG